ncbi:molybdenum cofactor guanylyltransferase MobA [Pseudomonas auratipiscis]|uniref:Molybdenum cofactor guanylyltransferase n=1 Tax=Pseudomonas auratipiscis TaxID=3115853 RepID=A0AB35WNJ0_9PSED|nr:MULTISPECIES: molybdenum cofactor guanylyltransferase MobA [unclassified Pseudomonas]MEE1865213.1 molybdenum cofactor guanylyltransferase MobA [Pseudomonas sp. 120P]MEE1955846.1 molybdenum cofactor guanylyltransferase MobA [Pseudomonas sp. 119P]
MPAATAPCSILLLAGGRGQRMGGEDKGLLSWQGKPLIAHIQAVVRPLTDDLIISCNRNHDQYRPFADQLVSDAHADFPGPLAGVLAGLAVARHRWMLVLACDAPLIDQALIGDLMNQANEQDQPAMVRQGGFWQPMFSLIPCALRADLELAWQQGDRGIQRALLKHPVRALEYGEDDPRLSNFNTPAFLQR